MLQERPSRGSFTGNLLLKAMSEQGAPFSAPVPRTCRTAEWVAGSRAAALACGARLAELPEGRCN